MKLNDKVYNVLKWIALIALDAFGNAYEQLANVWNLPYGTEIMRTCSIIAVLIGVLIGISSYKYNKEQKLKELEENLGKQVDVKKIEKEGK